jgi:hypothetical protein
MKQNINFEKERKQEEWVIDPRLADGLGGAGTGTMTRAFRSWLVMRCFRIRWDS